MSVVPLKASAAEKTKGATLTLAQIVRVEQTLISLSMQVVPPRFAYHLSRLLSLVQQQAKVYHTKRFEHIKALGIERDARPGESNDKTVFEVTPENMPKYQELIKELEAEEVAIDRWLLTLDQLTPLQVTGNDLQALGPLVTVPEDESK